MFFTQVWEEGIEFPQGLKPSVPGGATGTTEVVP